MGDHDVYWRLRRPIRHRIARDKLGILERSSWRVETVLIQLVWKAPVAELRCIWVGVDVYMGAIGKRDLMRAFVQERNPFQLCATIGSSPKVSCLLPDEASLFLGKVVLFPVTENKVPVQRKILMREKASQSVWRGLLLRRTYVVTSNDEFHGGIDCLQHIKRFQILAHEPGLRQVTAMDEQVCFGQWRRKGRLGHLNIAILLR